MDRENLVRLMAQHQKPRKIETQDEIDALRQKFRPAKVAAAEPPNNGIHPDLGYRIFIESVKKTK